MTHCRRKCKCKKPLLFCFSHNYCFTFSVTTEDTVYKMSMAFILTSTKCFQVDYLRNESRTQTFNEQKRSVLFLQYYATVSSFFSGCKVKTFSVMVKVSHLLPLNCVSFPDRRKTPRMKQQRQRKSLRKSARLSKSLEESCPTECCSVM